jgi:hypothetical protein
MRIGEVAQRSGISTKTIRFDWVRFHAPSPRRTLPVVVTLPFRWPDDLRARQLRQEAR